MKMTFDEIKKVFFRRRDNWKLEIDPNLPSHARCDNETKTVKLQYIPEKEDLWHLTLIHELCHSLPGCGTGTHGKVWQGEMLKKSKIAEKKGMANLAKMLIEEIKRYQKSIALGFGTCVDIYGRVEDIIIDNPTISYDDLLEGIAFEYGMTREEFEPSYKRLRKVFDTAKRLYH
jgi:hypothetical protein